MAQLQQNHNNTASYGDNPNLSLPPVTSGLKVVGLNRADNYNKMAFINVPSNQPIEISYKSLGGGGVSCGKLPPGNCSFPGICATVLKRGANVDEQQILIDKNFTGEIEVKVAGKSYIYNTKTAPQKTMEHAPSSKLQEDSIDRKKIQELPLSQNPNQAFANQTKNNEPPEKSSVEKKIITPVVEKFNLNEESKKYYNLGVSINVPEGKSYSIEYKGIANGSVVSGNISPGELTTTQHYENIGQLSKTNNSSGSFYFGAYKSFIGSIEVTVDGKTTKYTVGAMPSEQLGLTLPKISGGSAVEQKDSNTIISLGLNKWSVPVPNNASFQFLPNGGSQWLNFTTSKFTGSSANFFILTRQNDRVVLEGQEGFRYKVNGVEHTVGNVHQSATPTNSPTLATPSRANVDSTDILHRFQGIKLEKMLDGIASICGIGSQREKSFGSPLFIYSDKKYDDPVQVRRIASMLPEIINQLPTEYKNVIQESRICIGDKIKGSGLKSNFNAGDYILIGLGNTFQSNNELSENVKNNLIKGIEDMRRRSNTEIELSRVARELDVAKISLPYKNAGTADDPNNSPENVSSNIRKAIQSQSPEVRKFLESTQLVVGNYSTAFYQDKISALREPNYRSIYLPYSQDSEIMAHAIRSLLKGQFGI